MTRDEFGEELALEHAAAVQTLCKGLEMRGTFGNQGVVIAAGGDERVEPPFLVGHVRVATPEAVHARLEVLNLSAQCGGPFHDRGHLLLCDPDTLQLLLRVADVRADLFGPVADALQIGTPHELFLHPPPDFGVENVECV